MSTLKTRRDFLPAVTGGDGVKYTGWQESLGGLVTRLRRGVRGLRERLDAPTEDVSEWPGCVPAQKYFVPEPGVEQVDTAQTNAGTNPINFVVRSGKTYRIAIKFPGPGVFVGQWLKVACYMKFHDPSVPDDEWLSIVANSQPFNQNGAPNTPINWTTRFSVFPQQPSAGFASAFGQIVPPALNYVWNIEDPRTGRRYADKDLSQQFLLPRTWLPVVITSYGFQESLPDSDLFDLQQPYVLERDGQLTFLFRPLTDFIQFDSSLAGDGVVVGLPFDDRVNGKRDQTVLVQVELHGARFETMQDAVHAGALTQKW